MTQREIKKIENFLDEAISKRYNYSFTVIENIPYSKLIIDNKPTELFEKHLKNL